MAASENNACYHDRGAPGAGLLTNNQGAQIFNPWYSITKGDTVSNRDGDEIYATGMSVRLMYNAESDRPNQFVRIIVAVIPKVSSATIMDGTNFDLMDQAGSNDTVTGMIKREGVKCLYDKVFTLKSGGQNPEGTIGETRLFKKFYIKSRKGGKLKWQQDGTLVNKPVGIWVIPYDTYATLRSAALGVLSFTYKLYFKDI